VMSKTSMRLSGVLTAHSVWPSGEIARGLTWPLSNATNDLFCGPVVVVEAEPAVAKKVNMQIRKAIDRIDLFCWFIECGDIV
jgi:hypothetical protein